METSVKEAVDDLATAWTKELKPRLDRIENRQDDLEVRHQKAGDAGRAAPVEGRGPFLGLEEKAAPYFAGEAVDYNPRRVRLGALIAALGDYGKVKHALTADEEKAFSTVIDPAGGLLIPTVIGREFIDAVRPQTQVLAAGSRTYVMEAARVILPGWDHPPPKAGWRGPTGQFADAGGSFREVALNAQDVGAYVDVPNRLFDDAASNLDGVARMIEDQLQRAIAQAIDLAALLSQDALTAGGTHVPTGLANVDAANVVTANYGIAQATSSGTNGGAPTNYDWFIDAAATVYEANFTPTAHIGAPRTFSTLGKLKETTNAYLRPPEYLASVRDYQTGQIGKAYKKGTATDTSVSFIGDFSRMVIGVRGGLSVLRDPFTQGVSGMTRLIVVSRADVAVLDKGAFLILDGLRP